MRKHNIILLFFFPLLARFEKWLTTMAPVIRVLHLIPMNTGACPPSLLRVSTKTIRSTDTVDLARCRKCLPLHHPFLFAFLVNKTIYPNIAIRINLKNKMNR
ncbi:hypothetical protein HanHA300_Chr05g0180551 [Helianthus annuus]|nr:hypothetical protein HanHA300_Chr05g0180551 [Helianthus annuus]KAJ0584999.1 hypothetical protein HanHA89_Chr05g0195251 [Helianthus annuus]